MLLKKTKKMLSLCISTINLIPMFKTFAKTEELLTDVDKHVVIKKNTIGKYEGEKK